MPALSFRAGRHAITSDGWASIDLNAACLTTSAGALRHDVQKTGCCSSPLRRGRLEPDVRTPPLRAAGAPRQRDGSDLQISGRRSGGAVPAVCGTDGSADALAAARLGLVHPGGLHCALRYPLAAL